MDTTVKDTIEREIVLKAPVERVYAAISTPEQIVKWFPDGVKGDLKPDSRAVFDFGDFGEVTIYVVAANSPSYFAYRWLPSTTSKHFTEDLLTVPNTLVEFRLDEVPGGTRLRLKESGFAGLPAEFIASSLKDNNEGWDYMLARLEKVFA